MSEHAHAVERVAQAAVIGECFRELRRKQFGVSLVTVGDIVDGAELTAYSPWPVDAFRHYATGVFAA